MKTRSFVYSQAIDLKKIGWSEAKEDEEIVKYLQEFMKEEFDIEINKETALAFSWIIDDLLSDLQRKTIKL